MSVHGEHDDKVVVRGFLATSTRFRGIGGEQLPGKSNSANHKSRVSRNGHSLAFVCDRETNILENLNHKKAAPPLPDRILVASYVSAGRWSQTSLCYFHPQSFVLLLWIACLSDWLCAELFHTRQKTPTLHKSEVGHTQPEFCEGKKKKSSFIGLIFLSYPPPPHLNPVSFTGGNTVLESEFRLSQVNRATGPGGDFLLKKKSYLTSSHTTSVESS